MTEGEPQVLGDLLARGDRSGRPALSGGGRELDYRRFVTTSWKAGNYLRHLGVRSGSVVGVVGRTPAAVVSLFGATALGATVVVDPAANADLDALVAPSGRLSDFDAPGRSGRVGYGSEPDDPAASYFERDVWSENPVEPPEPVSPNTPAVRDGEETWTHAAVLDAARDAVDRGELSSSDAVAVRAPLADPTVVATGVVAPLLAGGCVLVPEGDETGTVAVVEGCAPESRTLVPTG